MEVPSIEMGNIPGRISLTDGSYPEEVKNSYQVSSSKITSETLEKTFVSWLRFTKRMSIDSREKRSEEALWVRQC